MSIQDFSRSTRNDTSSRIENDSIRKRSHSTEGNIETLIRRSNRNNRIIDSTDNISVVVREVIRSSQSTISIDNIITPLRRIDFKTRTRGSTFIVNRIFTLSSGNGTSSSFRPLTINRTVSLFNSQCHIE